MATQFDPNNVQDWDEPLNTDPMFTSTHIFSTADITVTFDGDTIGSLADPQSVFDTAGLSGVPTKDSDGTTLYPIDSEFGFYVTDFSGAEDKVLDGDYAEGWAGDLIVGGEQIGVVISDAPTDEFKTPAKLGTWLAGLGGNSVKASTEHYVVMQNILSDQKFPGDDTAVYQLDDDLVVIGGTYDGQLVADVIPQVGDVNGDGVEDIKDVLAPNESTIRADIAVSDDYSVTLKDDGKLLYRWGNMVKRPNDIRMDVKLDLPDDWGEITRTTGLRTVYKVSEAELVMHHLITNNPNDQLRPEDFENEAAIGKLPTYEVVEDYNLDGLGPREVWLSVLDYYAGDGTLYEAGTILKDAYLAQKWAESDLGALGAADGAEGFTNAWYTTMDREPFEPELTEDNLAYDESGPRWRLKPNKYGQDLPGVEIPIDPSAPPPPTRDEIKYEVGAETQTVLNLLDWGTPTSPLELSAGWQDKPGEVSVNGMNYTDKFDLAVYVKGDQKPTEVYSAELLMDYEEIATTAVGSFGIGTDGDDYFVGMGFNDFRGGAGSDVFVVSYASSLPGVDLFSSVIRDFVVGEDTLGFIDLGVNDDNFDEWVSQTVNGGNLEVYIDRDGAGSEEAPELVATLLGVTEELDPLEGDFYIANPWDGVIPGYPPANPDLIVGTAKSETLLGTADDNTILGLDGIDYLYGLDGNDVLDGGGGFDRLFGGDGADTFVFDTGTWLDFVFDFEDGIDVIQLTGVNEADFATDVSITAWRSYGTEISVDGDRMIIFNDTPDAFTIDDFIFADTPVV